MTPDSGPTRTGESTEYMADDASLQREATEVPITEQKMDDASLHLLTINEVFVYKVPPLRASSGYRAEEWGLESPVFAGSLRIFGNTTEEKIHICVYRPKTETDNSASSSGLEFDIGSANLFCDCCVDAGKDKVLSQYIEGVMDSSRYFVLRVEDPSMKRVAYLGIGFRDRDSAFDFKASLDDFMKRALRSRMAEDMWRHASSIDVDEKEENGADTSSMNRPMKDLSLSKDVKIHIPTRGDGSGRRSRRNSLGKGGDEGSGMVLIPPPPSNVLITPQQKDDDKEKELDTSETATNTTADAEGWSNFESA